MGAVAIATEISARSADRYLAMGLVDHFAAEPTIHCLIYSGDPIVKSRARVVRGGQQSYTPAKTRRAQGALAAALRARMPTFTGNVAIACVFRRANRQRLDLDNLLKLVLDAGTQAKRWEDDCQVTALVGILEYDHDDPRTTIAMAAHASSMLRGPDAKPKCVVCGNTFESYGNPRRQHCSRECRMTLAEPVNCPICEQPFKRHNNNQKYCSNQCRYKAQIVNRACANCGARRAKSNSTLCRVCWLATKGQQPLGDVP